MASKVPEGRSLSRNPPPAPRCPPSAPRGRRRQYPHGGAPGQREPLSPTAVRRPGLGDKSQGVCSDFLGDFSIRSITFSSRQKSIPVPEVVEGARTRALRISRGPRAPGAWARAGNQQAWGGRCAGLGGGPVRGRLNETSGRGWQGMAVEKDRDLFFPGRGPLVCRWFLGCTPFPAPRPPAPVLPLRRRSRSLPERSAPLCRARGAPREVSLKAWQPRRRAFLRAAAGKELGPSSRSTRVRVVRPQGTPFAPRPQTCSWLPQTRARAIPLKGANRVLAGTGVGIASSETGDSDWGQKPLAAVPRSPRSAEGSAEATAPGMG